MSGKRKQEIESALETFQVEVWQKKPYTAVKVIAVYESIQYEDVAFCKVSWPDAWDEDHGFTLAKTKALSSIAAEILEEIIALEEEERILEEAKRILEERKACTPSSELL